MTKGAAMVEPNEEINYSDLTVNEVQLNSLILTFFYADSGEGLALLQERTKVIYRSLKEYADKQHSELSEAPGFEGWTCTPTPEFKHLYCSIRKSIRGSGDTTAIQIGMSTLKPVKEGWPDLQRVIEHLVTNLLSDSREPRSSLKFIGYSEVYKCNSTVLTKGRRISSDVIRLASPLFVEDKNLGHQLSSHDFPDGKLVLISTINYEKHGHLTYIALNEPEKEDQLIYNHLFLDNFQMLTIQAYLHKATYQWLQFKDYGYKTFYNNLMKLQEDTIVLLKTIGEPVRRQSKNRLIGDLAHHLALIMIPHNAFKEALLSIKMQLKNLAFKTSADEEFLNIKNQLYRYHINTISNQIDDCELTLSRAELIISQAQTGINILDARQSQQFSIGSNRLQVILAITGLGLATIQILDNDTVVQLIKSSGLLHSESEVQIVGWKTTLAKFSLTGLIMILAYLIYKLFTTIKQRSKLT